MHLPHAQLQLGRTAEHQAGLPPPGSRKLSQAGGRWLLAVCLAHVSLHALPGWAADLLIVCGRAAVPAEEAGEEAAASGAVPSRVASRAAAGPGHIVRMRRGLHTAALRVWVGYMDTLSSSQCNAVLWVLM